MARVVVSDLADADTAKMLEDVTRDAGWLVADRYNADLENLYARLAEYPDSCQARPELGAHVRVGLVHPYLVIYRHSKGSVTVGIVRILHGSRRITRKLLRGG
jgi:plasmid stabilization system protein ParE